MATQNVVVIGAGPAGVRAAETLVEAGIRPIVIDENERDGGQMYRRQPENFTRPNAKLYGTETQRAEALHARFDVLKARIDYRPRHLAWNIAESHVHVVHDGQAEALHYAALIIASGATDRIMPMAGWHLAGTYSLGAAQIALKAQAVSIGKRVAFVGSGPLLYLVASQYAKAGASVVAVLDTSTLGKQLLAAPRLSARPDALFKGVQLVSYLKRAGVPVLRGVTPLAIAGHPDSGVSGISVRLRSGLMRQFDCDAVALGYHIRPEAQLADLAGCAFEFEAATRQYRPAIDLDGRTSVPGIYLAGDGAVTQGADGAEISGKLAALAALSYLGRAAAASADVSRLRRERLRMERFRLGLVRAFPWPHHLAAELADDTLVCRCEGITAGELRAVAREKVARELNRAKALSRVGMGRCQGRYCGHAAAEIVAAETGVSLEAVGRLRGQAPVKPLAVTTKNMIIERSSKP
jgi:NADPH-dependent 2,4-dienoyl-CoA reductase/sulfur reductase-like enzyme